jgi:hypothetical protein
LDTEQDVQDVNPPESPRIVDARIVRHPETDRECLLARDEDGRLRAFAFEVDGDAPGISLVDPALWRDALGADQAARFDAIEEAWADDWLPSVVAHPVGDEWLKGIKAAHPSAFREWFAMTQYETGGEEGSGGGI